jgi:hypothetical protein
LRLRLLSLTLLGLRALSLPLLRLCVLGLGRLSLRFCRLVLVFAPTLSQLAALITRLGSSIVFPHALAGLCSRPG